MELSARNVKKALSNPLYATKYFGYQGWGKVEKSLSSQLGWVPFDNDWDVLVILDACRYDLAQEYVETTQLGEPDSIWSLGAHSQQWITRTFGLASNSKLKETAYISANPFTNRAPAHKMASVDNVQKYAFNTEAGTVLPRAITDRGIDTIRSGDANRYILHYIQPHLPSINRPGEFSDFIEPPGAEPNGSNPWKDIEKGELEGKAVERAYRENLAPVLEEVELLLSNIDAEKVVITADHGNYLGEQGRWGHSYRHSIHPAVRLVPYWEVKTVDTKSHEPAEYDTSSENSTQEERLEALGYR